MSTPAWRSAYSQTDLFGETAQSLTRPRVAVMVGQFFEQLTGAIFADTDVDHYLNAGDDRPDVIAWGAGQGGTDLLIESKASTSGHLFDVNQLHTYRSLCRRRDTLWNKPTLYYALWCYSGERLWSSLGSSHSLLDHLCNHVDALYLLPGSLVESLVESIGVKTYESWRGSKRATAGHYARLSRLHHHILRWGRPEAIKTVCGLLDVPLGGNNVTRTTVDTATLDERKVAPFPVVMVSRFSLKQCIL